MQLDHNFKQILVKKEPKVKLMQVGVEKLGTIMKVGVYQALYKQMEYSYKLQLLE